MQKDRRKTDVAAAHGFVSQTSKQEFGFVSQNPLSHSPELDFVRQNAPPPHPALQEMEAA
jgi:hypothetical protein